MYVTDVNHCSIFMLIIQPAKKQRGTSSSVKHRKHTSRKQGLMFTTRKSSGVHRQLVPKGSCSRLSTFHPSLGHSLALAVSGLGSQPFQLGCKTCQRSSLKDYDLWSTDRRWRADILGYGWGRKDMRDNLLEVCLACFIVTPSQPLFFSTALGCLLASRDGI